MAGSPPRDNRGKWVRDVTTIERDAECTRLRSRGLSYRAIANELGIDVHSAHEGVQRCLAETLTEAATELRQIELERLDTLYAAATAVLEREHITVNNGKVIYQGDTPLADDAPVLAAIDRLLKISESRRKLLGLDSPEKVSLSGGVTYELVGVDVDQLR